MGSGTAAIAIAIVLIAVAVGAAFIAMNKDSQQSSPSPPPAYRVTLASQRIGGQPEQNTSSIWVARVTSVTSPEPLHSYGVSLLVNGTRIIGPVFVARGTLGTFGSLVFEFFEEGTYCYPDPCPPPEGPDGMLSLDDYFRISNAVPDTAYTVQILWAATVEVTGEIVIQT